MSGVLVKQEMTVSHLLYVTPCGSLKKTKKELILDSLGASVIEEAVKTCLHNITAKTSTCLKKGQWPRL